VADADPSVVRAASAVLSAEGVRVATAGSAEDALTAARGERFDLVLADVRLRLPSGVRLLDALAADPDLAPTAALALANPGDTSPTLGDIPLALLIKPFSPLELREAARNLLPPR
jgi:CheY-like chemotaxis protein